MSEPVLAVPLSRLFAEPTPPPGSSARERQQQAVDAAFKAGRAAAEAELLPRIAELEARLETLQAEMAQALEAEARRCDAMLAALEPALADAVVPLALAVAERVLAAEPTLRAETLAALVAEALAGLPEGSGGALRMNPGDAARALALPAGWTIVADPARAPGDMIAERGASLAAAALSRRLAQATAALEGGA